MIPLEVGTMAPDFTLPIGDGDFYGEQWTLSQASDRNIVLAFYPADWSSVCGSQIALYNELIPLFKDLEAELLGISVDGTHCHKAFKGAKNISLQLLCDFEPKGNVAKLYQCYNSEIGVCERALYVIDKSGKVRYSYISPMEVNPGAKEILETLEMINQET